MDIVRFGELYSIPSSNGLSRPSAVRGEGYKMINMGELFAYDIIHDVPMDRVKLSTAELEKFLVQDGDLLFARQSLVAEGAGKCSIVSGMVEPTTFESHLIRVRLNTVLCNPWYYYYLFKLANNPIKTIVNQCAQAGIRGNELHKVKVPLPTKGFQDKLAGILRGYDDLIDANTRRIKLLELMAENLYKEWFVCFRFPGYETAEFENGVPKGWKYKNFSNIIQLTRGISYSSEEIECDDGTNLINLKNIQAFGGFRHDGTKKYNGQYKDEQMVIYKDLIMGVTDMTQDRRTVGAVALVPSIKGVISADLVKLNSSISTIFLYCLFRYGSYSKFISQFGNGANVIHLRPDSIKNIKILIPSKCLIDAFVKAVEPMIDTICKLTTCNENLTKQRDLLLPRLMSGKLKV